MKDALINELFDTVYYYYPRGIPNDDARHRDTEENLRLVAARRIAGTDRRAWLSMLERLEGQFPDSTIQDDSIALVSGAHDACYSGSLSLSKAHDDHDHRLIFMVSFVVRRYSIFSVRTVEDAEKMAVARASQGKNVCVFENDTCYFVPIDIVKPEVIREQEPLRIFRNEVHFYLSPDEQQYAECITREIEATWGYERMPPELEKVIVPDVVTNLRDFGEATLHDCLFSDQW